jgi:hypothetical protein
MVSWTIPLAYIVKIKNAGDNSLTRPKSGLEKPDVFYN